VPLAPLVESLSLFDLVGIAESGRAEGADVRQCRLIVLAHASDLIDGNGDALLMLTVCFALVVQPPPSRRAIELAAHFGVDIGDGQGAIAAVVLDDSCRARL